MADLDEAILNSLPEKSRVSYNKAWDDFQVYRNTLLKTTGGVMPNLDDYMSYFTHLRNVKKYKGSSLWSTYSRLNSIHLRLYHSRLQDWRALSQLISGFSSGDPKKKFNVFTKDQLELFVSNAVLDEDKYWLTRKAVVILAFFGGHRCVDLRDINMEDVTQAEDGFYVTYKRAKQPGQVKVSKYLVPKAKTLPTDNSRCWASVLNKYMEALHQDLNESTGPLFRAVGKAKIRHSPMGINKLYNVGKELAILLKLPNAEDFTGHCFRQSAPTEVTEYFLLEGGAIPHISVPYPPQIQDQVQDNSDDDDAGDPLCLSGDSLKTEPAADSSSGQVQAPPASANIVLTGFKRKRNFLEFAEEVSVDLQVGAKKSCPSSSSSSSSLSESATSPAVCRTEEERLHYVIIGLKRVISSLTDENSALKKQVKNLTSVTEKDKEISESEKYAVLKEKLGEHLTPTQIACFYYGGDWKNCVWDKEDLTRAFTLRQLGMSRQAYSHLRAKRILPLPSLSTLKDAKTVLSNTKNKNGQ